MTKEYLDKIIQLVTASFGLVAALAWNTVIQETLDRFFPAGDGLTGKYIYAVVITLVAVWATTSLARIHDAMIKKEEKKAERAAKKK